MSNKKKVFILGCIVVISLICLFFINTSRADNSIETIQFSDKQMYLAVLNQIQNEYDITFDNATNTINIINTDLERIEKLELNNNNISNISGIEKFTNLQELNISNNNIKDITKLQTLTNLRTLKAFCNTISNTSAISGLGNLNYLDLSKNKLDDSNRTKDNCLTTNLSNLTNLKELNLSHNYLIYISEIENLTALESLDLYDNAICDIQEIGNLTNLVTLKLGENNEFSRYTISGVSELSSLTNLKYLDFSENKTSDIISSISGLTNLEYLSLEGNNIVNLTGIENLIKLKVLNLYSNKIVDISKLYELQDLEELIIQENSIKDITGMIKNNELVWPEMKKLYIHSNQVDLTLNAQVVSTIRQMSNNHEIELSFSLLTYTNNLPHYDKNNVPYVTYEDFGARCDGEYDDWIAIRNAHNYANKYGYEVRATANKTYHIYKFYEGALPIRTSVDWSNATFVIHDEDIEEKSARYKTLFWVNNLQQTITLQNPNWTIGKNTHQIPELASQIESYNQQGYNRYFCIAYNSEKKQYIREGANENSGSEQRDNFIIDSDTNVLNDIQWDFDKITSIEIYPMSNDRLTIKNGTFISNALESKSETTYVNLKYGKKNYFYRDISINKAANIDISNITHKLPYEAGEDEMSGSYRGFFYIDKTADMNVTNCSLYSRKYSIDGRSTYGLTIDNSTNLIFDSIISNDIFEPDRWGIVGTNFAKYVTFSNCYINRIDAHCGIYNLDVDNCHIGTKNLTMTGQGTLNIRNTRIESSAFITLRADYGSVWDGTVNITDCTYVHKGENFVPKIIHAEPNYAHDFGYDCKMPKINIKNLTIDMTYGKKTNYVLLMNMLKVFEDDIEFWQNYVTDSVNINKISIINGNDDTKFYLLKDDYKDYINNYNYFVTDLEIKENGSDIDTLLENSEDIYTTSNSINLKITRMQAADNYVSIYKDNTLIVDNMLVNSIYENSFTDSGEYRLVINSESDRDGYLGTKTYYFNIESYTININEPAWSCLPVMQKRSLNAEIIPAQNIPISWNSSNTSVATIDSSSGEINALSNGTTIITATAGSVSDTYTLTVNGILGDVDNDNEVTSFDAYSALLLSVGQNIGEHYEDDVVVLDVDSDTDVTAWDAYRILVYSVGSITEF